VRQTQPCGLVHRQHTVESRYKDVRYKDLVLKSLICHEGLSIYPYFGRSFAYPYSAILLYDYLRSASVCEGRLGSKPMSSARDVVKGGRAVGPKTWPGFSVELFPFRCGLMHARPVSLWDQGLEHLLKHTLFSRRNPLSYTSCGLSTEYSEGRSRRRGLDCE
jgi:hypothetical protein